MARSVVADAGPLIAFGRIERLDLLPQVLGEVLVPHTVIGECMADAEKPGARAIKEAFRTGILTRVADPKPALPPFPILELGESTAIRLALKLSTSVLIDEKAGRKIATNLGLTVIGSGGVLLAAKKQGLIESVRPILDAFIGNGYQFSPALVRAILVRANER